MSLCPWARWVSSQIWPWKLDRRGPEPRGHMIGGLFIRRAANCRSRCQEHTGAEGEKGISEGKHGGRKGSLMEVVGAERAEHLNPFNLEVFCWKWGTSWSSFCFSVSHVTRELYYSEIKLVIWLRQADLCKQPKCGCILYWPQWNATKCLDQNFILCSLLRNFHTDHSLNQHQVLNHIWRHDRGTLNHHKDWCLLTGTKARPPPSGKKPWTDPKLWGPIRFVLIFFLNQNGVRLFELRDFLILSLTQYPHSDTNRKLLEILIFT